MPGVNGPVSESFFQRLANLETIVRGMATQQQITLSGSNGQPVLTLGLVPGSVPAEYGLQLVDPATGDVVAFLGENSSGTQLNVSGTLNVTGNTLIGGNLSVPNGSITNAGLQNPAAATSWRGELDNLTLPTSLTYYFAHTMAPPSSRYTTAALTLIGMGQAAWGSATGVGDLSVTPSATNGAQSLTLGFLPAQSATGNYANVSIEATVAGVFTNVPTSGFTVSLGAEVSGGFAASSGSLSLAASVIWLP